jgi:hypothetical protein
VVIADRGPHHIQHAFAVRVVGLGHRHDIRKRE